MPSWGIPSLSYLSLPRKGPSFCSNWLLLVWPFVLDTTFTFFRRLRKGENVFAAHRSHLYQRLVILGCSHRFVTLIYMGLALVGTILSLLWFMRVDGSEFAVVIILPLLCLGLWLLSSIKKSSTPPNKYPLPS